MNWQPLEDEQLRITSTWTRTSIENEVNGFPAVTAALEAALPDRFTRDGDGTLIAVDARGGTPCEEFGDNGQVDITVGMGEAMPVADNSTASGREANRRVEITMVPVTSG